MWAVLLSVGCVLGAGITLGAWVLWERRRRRLWSDVRQVVDAIVSGRIERSRTRYTGFDRMFTGSLLEMAEAVHGKLHELRQERDVLNHVLENLTTGVVLIGHEGRVQLVNEAAEHMFLRPRAQWLGREHWAVLRPYRIGGEIARALREGVPWQGTLQLRENLVVEARLIPLPADREPLPGDNPYDALLLCTDVSEWRRLERMRSEFVANVSHELKTPIAAIRGFAETLLDEEVDTDTRRAFLRTIYEESTRMANLVSDLLQLSKLEFEGHAVHPRAVALRDAVHGAIERVAGEARRHQIEIETRGCDDIVVWADPDRLLQVLLNLLTNAVHYTPDGGRVIVWCEPFVDHVKVHVQDTGIGIPPEDQARVFERFYRVDRARSRSSGGTGLGLAIVKHIVQAHGGEVGVHSEMGRGSDFWFTLARLETGSAEVHGGASVPQTKG
ncbi:MAG: PAS domain-containing protein [Thermoflavifilum sp.]|nr:PAS domain-containing protein [Thermoflavifilum sp.]MCL6515157.1 PAS domain-containing protein [Alicyclobacillus sp.]